MKIFVGNLSFQTSETQLRTLFEEFGTVNSVKIINDAYSQRSRGFGFVEMQENGEAENAIAKLHNFMLDHKSLVVNEARPQSSDRRSGFASDKGFNKRY
jgi:RNA recognition motif-containing protein